MTTEKSGALTVPEPHETLHPMAMIQLAFQTAIERGGPEALAVADRILEQMAKQRDYQDREAFNAALRRIQDELKPIAKLGVNPETHSRYATAESIDEAIEWLLQREGMTLSFEPEPHPLPDMVRIVGILGLGAYSKRYPLDMPADGKGPKGGGIMSRTHATGSAITYSKRYLKNMIFNLRFKEKDDDGNRAGGKQPGTMDEREFLTHRDNIANAGNKGELQRLYLTALDSAEHIGDPAAIKQIIAAKDKRLKELSA